MKLRRKCFASTWRIKISHVGDWNFPRDYRVLFLKKVHSWEGVTEMVHGLFLLVGSIIANAKLAMSLFFISLQNTID